MRCPNCGNPWSGGLCGRCQVKRDELYRKTGDFISEYKCGSFQINFALAYAKDRPFEIFDPYKKKKEPWEY